MYFVVPGEPKGKGRPRFGKGRTYTPEETVRYEALVRECFGEQCGYEMPFAEETPVIVNIWAAYGIPESYSKKKAAAARERKIFPTKKPDCDNIIKIICDALNGLAYVDDRQIVSVSCRKVYADEPYVGVYINEKLEDE